MGAILLHHFARNPPFPPLEINLGNTHGADFAAALAGQKDQPCDGKPMRFCIGSHERLDFAIGQNPVLCWNRLGLPDVLQGIGGDPFHFDAMLEKMSGIGGQLPPCRWSVLVGRQQAKHVCFQEVAYRLACPSLEGWQKGFPLVLDGALAVLAGGYIGFERSA